MYKSENQVSLLTEFQVLRFFVATKYFLQSQPQGINILQVFLSKDILQKVMWKNIIKSAHL